MSEFSNVFHPKPITVWDVYGKLLDEIEIIKGYEAIAFRMVGEGDTFQPAPIDSCDLANRPRLILKKKPRQIVLEECSYEQAACSGSSSAKLFFDSRGFLYETSIKGPSGYFVRIVRHEGGEL